MNEKNSTDCETLILHIVSVIDTCCDAAIQSLHYLNDSNIDGVVSMLECIEQSMQAIYGAQMPILERLEHAYTSEMIENVQCSIEEINNALRNADPHTAAMKAEFQLFPFLRQLKEAFYFWGLIYPDKAKMDRYYCEEFAEHYKNYYISDKWDIKYDLSIVVTGYNHLDVTQKCIEHLLKETNFQKLNAELILVDHGSTDGTLEYFKSIGANKIIHFKKNARMYMFATIFQVCEGKRIAFVSNDVLVTHNWAEILEKCMDSDENIAMVVPQTPNICNYQLLRVTPDDPDKFIEWASHHNESNSLYWEDRARLMPPAAIYNVEKANQVGFADPLFFTMEFWDDDLCLRLRRQGYRLVLCGDIACYHFGSVTGKAAQKKENTLEVGRDIFIKKHGVDPWTHDFCYDYSAVAMLQESMDNIHRPAILCIDGGFGDTALQIRNLYRNQGKNCKIYHITTEQAYKQDLENYADGFALTTQEKLVDTIQNAFPKMKFSHIYFGKGMEEYYNTEAILKTISSRMNPQANIVFTVKNPYFVMNFKSMMEFSFFKDKIRTTYMSLEYAMEISHKIFNSACCRRFDPDIIGIDSFIKRFWPNENVESIKNKINTEKYYFLCSK